MILCPPPSSHLCVFSVKSARNPNAGVVRYRRTELASRVGTSTRMIKVVVDWRVSGIGALHIKLIPAAFAFDIDVLGRECSRWHGQNLGSSILRPDILECHRLRGLLYVWYISRRTRAWFYNGGMLSDAIPNRASLLVAFDAAEVILGNEREKVQSVLQWPTEQRPA